jgi:hypothetical protein
MVRCGPMKSRGNLGQQSGHRALFSGELPHAAIGHPNSQGEAPREDATATSTSSRSSARSWPTWWSFRRQGGHRLGRHGRGALRGRQIRVNLGLIASAAVCLLFAQKKTSAGRAARSHSCHEPTSFTPAGSAIGLARRLRASVECLFVDSYLPEHGDWGRTQERWPLKAQVGIRTSPGAPL